MYIDVLDTFTVIFTIERLSEAGGALFKLDICIKIKQNWEPTLTVVANMIWVYVKE